MIISAFFFLSPSYQEGDKKKIEMRTKSFIVLVFTLFGSVHLFGQESRKEICIDFRVGKSTLDTAYVNNAERLAEIVSFLETVKNDEALDLVEVSLCGSA